MRVTELVPDMHLAKMPFLILCEEFLHWQEQDLTHGNNLCGICIGQ